MNRTRSGLICQLLVLFFWAAGPAAGQEVVPTTGGTAPPEVCFVPFSHLDLYWGGTREECLTRGNAIMAQAIRLGKQSPKFRFLLEDEVFVANFLESHRDSAEVKDLMMLVREGQIELAPKWAAIYQELCDGEAQVRNLAIGKRYARSTFGVDPQVVHLGDLPGYAQQFPQLMRQAGVPYMVMTRMGPSDKSLFYWKAPDGSKALVWSSLKSYAWGTFLHSKAKDEDKLRRLRKDLAEVRATTPGPILMHFGCDLWSMPNNLVEMVDRINTSGAARMTIATPIEYFRRAEKTPAIPELTGEIPSSWPNLIPSLPHIWPPLIPAINTLLAAEKFAALNDALGYAKYPGGEFESIWKRLLESADHNQDGQGGTAGDRGKIEYQQTAVVQGGQILRDMLRNIAERVRVPDPEGFAIVVFNPLGWNRDDVVKTRVALFGAVAPSEIAPFTTGMRLLDENGKSVPFHVEQSSGNISRTMDLVFAARDVPSMGYKTYTLTAAPAPDAFPPAATLKLDAENDRREPRRPLGRDTIENNFYRLTVDRATGRVTLFDKALGRDVCRDMEVSALEERGGNYIGIEPLSGRNFFSVVDGVTVEENNAVRAVVRIDLRLADNPITQRLTLYSGLKRLDIENTVDWKTHRLMRIRQAFPLVDPQAAIHYGVPYGANSAENVMPNAGPHLGDEITNAAWQQVRFVQNWIHAGSSNGGLTIATDRQLVRLEAGTICGEMLRGTRFTSTKVVRGDQASSMLYPPPGTYVFRFSLASAAGDWKTAKAYRTGIDFNNPLLPIYVADAISAKTLPPSQSFCSLKADNLVLSALKKADDGSSLIARFYEMEGKQAETPVVVLGRRASLGEVNLLEEDLGSKRQSILKFSPYSIKTIKFNLGRETQ